MIQATTDLYAVFKDKPDSRVYLLIGWDGPLMQPHLIPLRAPITPPMPFGDATRELMGEMLVFPSLVEAEAYRNACGQRVHRQTVALVRELEQLMAGDGWGVA